MQHESLFDTKAAWNYRKMGHGKGPCDGLGGNSKRTADNVIKQRKYTIQYAIEFFSWAESTQVSIKILYEYISCKDVASCAEELKPMNSRPMHGTIKFHVAVGSVDGICYRNTSYYCVNCFKNWVFTYNYDGWKSFSRSEISESASTVTESVSTLSSLIKYALGDFVAAI